MRYIRYISIAIFAVALILIALANRGQVLVKVLPDELADFVAVNPSYELPMFIVIFGGILVGLVIGFIWEWMREAKGRGAAGRQSRELNRLRNEVSRLKGAQPDSQDEVLAILDKAS